MNFDGAPMIDGVWMNKNTGEKIQIRDTIIDGDDMLLMTNVGTQISMNVFSRDYMQVSEEYYDENGNVISDTDTLNKIKENEIQSTKPDITSMITTDIDDNFFDNLSKKHNVTSASTALVNDYTEQKPDKKQCQTTIKKPKHSKNYELLNKLFTKVNIKPHFNITDCDNFPTQQLRMLKDFYDVTDDDIAEYLIEYIFTNDDLKSIIVDFLNTKFDEK